MKKLVYQVWERAALYLPTLLMGVLALGTYWLVRSTPVPGQASPAAPVRHEPDYLMNKFSVKTYDGNGRLKSEIVGAQARHFPDVDTLEIDGVRIRAYDEAGQLTLATASRALINADASELQLFGDARVVREPVPDKAGVLQPRLEFRGEFLHAFMKTERVLSPQPLQLTRGQDQFTADAMEFDNLAQVMQLTGRVRGTLVPKPGK
jgi:lipopolysaccharide export system protein LptC